MLTKIIQTTHKNMKDSNSLEFQAPGDLINMYLRVYQHLCVHRVASSYQYRNESSFIFRGASLVAQMVKNLPALQKTWVWSLGQEDSLEEEMATHSSMLAWRISWTEAGGLQSMQTVGHD